MNIKIGLNKMKVILFLICIVCLPAVTFAQTYSWYQLPNSPYDFGRFENASFINENTGWVIKLTGTVYRTLDGGNSWTLQDSIYLGGFRSVQFINESTGWIGSLNTSFILFKTTDGGFSWDTVRNIPDPKPRGICGLHALNEQFIYGCGRYDGNSNFIKSTDGGNTWITKDMAQFANALVDCYFFNKDTGVAVGSIGVIPTYKSTALYTIDGGVNWSVRFTGTRNQEGGWKISFVDNQNGFVSLELLGSTLKHFIKTSDGGQTWSEYSFPNSNEQGIGFINANTGWIGGNFNPTYGTTDGGMTWFNSNIGININRFLMFGDTLGYACGQYIFKYSKTIGITQISSTIPDRYSLFQNYPNPFNPVTKIKFDLLSNTEGQTSNVKLDIYDALGKEVQVLVNEKLSAGSYEVEFNAIGFSSGIYFYKLTTENFTQTKRMVLLK